MAVALQSGAQHIDAVEVNPQTIEFAANWMHGRAAYSATQRCTFTWRRPRRFVAGSSDRWDHINLTLLQTSPAIGRGRSRVDGRVLTVEAVQTYLNHLQPLGILAVIQNSPLLAERTRLSVLAANGGHSDRIVELRLPISQDVYNPFNHLLLARNEAFDEPELYKLRLLASELGAEFVPDPTGLDGRPTTDDRPFLFEPGFFNVAHALVAGALALMALVAVFSWERKAPGNIIRASAAVLVGMVYDGAPGAGRLSSPERGGQSRSGDRPGTRFGAGRCRHGRASPRKQVPTACDVASNGDPGGRRRDGAHRSRTHHRRDQRKRRADPCRRSTHDHIYSDLLYANRITVPRRDSILPLGRRTR